MFYEFDWLKELQMLILKYSHLGINPDLSTMTLSELWGVYCHLRALG